MTKEIIKLYRIKSYYPDGRFTGCEHIYTAGNSSEALARFRGAYPEHDSCIVTAQEYDPAESPEHFAACLRCGCVH